MLTMCRALSGPRDEKLTKDFASRIKLTEKGQMALTTVEENTEGNGQREEESAVIYLLVRKFSLV